jgi:hypothetical protein
VSQDTFHTTNRPYVGLSYVGPSDAGQNARPGGKDKFGNFNYVPGTGVETVRMLAPLLKFPFTVEYRNYGSIPARDVNIAFTTRINGDVQTLIQAPREPATLFPDQSSTNGGAIETNRLASVLDGTSLFEIEINITYKGVTEERYSTHEKARYDHVCGCYFKMASDFK